MSDHNHVRSHESISQLPLFDPVEIPLTKGYVALVDPVDADLLQYKWLARSENCIYAMRFGKRDGKHRPRYHLHRIILERMLERPLNQSEQVDHIDGNGLNNRRHNLRVASYAENARNKTKYKNNTSGYKGVFPRKGKWRSTINVDRNLIYLGDFNTPEEAHAAYVEAALKYHGAFARTE